MTIQAEERRSARLAAVQALYQMEISGEGAEEVAEQFIAHRFAELVEAGMPAPDEAFFSAILQGVPAHQVEIDRAVASALSELEAGSGGFHPARDPALRRVRACGAPRCARQGCDR